MDEYRIEKWVDDRRKKIDRRNNIREQKLYNDSYDK